MAALIQVKKYRNLFSAEKQTNVRKTNQCKEIAYNKNLVDTIRSEAGLLNKSSCLAPALGVTKFIRFIAMN